ncbi:hypothetical protein [Apibacter muscae]|nr:hypothetical protein [Apibacter muscae]
MEKLIKLSSFRTNFRTNKIFVLMNTRFVPRTQPNKQGEHRMYNYIS